LREVTAAVLDVAIARTRSQPPNQTGRNRPAKFGTSAANCWSLRTNHLQVGPSWAETPMPVMGAMVSRSVSGGRSAQLAEQRERAGSRNTYGESAHARSPSFMPLYDRRRANDGPITGHDRVPLAYSPAPIRLRLRCAQHLRASRQSCPCMSRNSVALKLEAIVRYAEPTGIPKNRC